MLESYRFDEAFIGGTTGLGVHIVNGLTIRRTRWVVAETAGSI